MSASSRSDHHPAPLASDLESLLEVEEQIERTLAEARERAAHMVDEARVRAERDADELAAELERARARLCTEAGARARADLEALEREAAGELAGYRELSRARIDAVAERVCRALVRSLVGGGGP